MAPTLPNADDIHMPARYFAQLCQLLSDEGLDTDCILQGTGLQLARMEAPEAEISLGELEKFIAQAEDCSGRKDLGFLLGRRINVSNHEILGYGMLTSPTLEHSLKLAARYYHLMTPLFAMQYRRGPHTTELIFQPTLLIGQRALRFMIETIGVSTHEVIKTLSQGCMPNYEFRVSYPEPQHVSLYRQLRPAQMKFEAEALPGIRLVFDTALMDKPLALADRNALKMAEARCEEMLRKASRDEGVAGWVSMMMREATQGFPTLAELARLCNQSPRTLERQLEREGHRYAELAKSIRHSKACDLLRDTSQSITQVAYELGYREVSSFTRAFIRESGSSPREFRKTFVN